MPPPRRNIHGRKGGRGLRPWLLIPKYLCVSVYFGSLAAIATLERICPPIIGDNTVAVALYLMFPAATLAGVLGIGLWLQHPKTFLRTRWFQLKMALVLIGLPAFELLAWWPVWRSWLQSPAFTDGSGDNTWRYFIYVQRFDAPQQAGLVGALATLVAIIILGRLKPRLGQRPKTLTKPPDDER